MAAAPDSADSSKGGRLIGWIDERFPLTKLWKDQVAEYYAPKNFNFWYYFGSLALFILVIQLVTGIFLAMNYKPSSAEAFASVEYIMRDVNWGWLIRYLHSTGASAFFIVVYLHMFRALLYGSHRKPRELLWIFGCLIFLLLMAEGFMGYVLPWGNMSYWGAQVIVSLFGSLPYVGGALVDWIRGDYYIADATLNRFFALHVAALPLALIFLVIAHLMALHEVGSNNPDGIEIHDHEDAAGHPLDGIPFHPYYTVKDIVGVAGFLLVFCAVIFFAPTLGGLFLESPNFEPANALQTPPHIAPVWYFTPFYAMLRAVPSFAGTQIWGVLVMGASIVVLFFVPWLDHSPVASIRYRGPIYKVMLAIFVASFITLGICGLKPPSGIYPTLAKICTVLYFAFFLLMPWYTKFDSVKPVPERVTGHG
ncbi:MAG TPA: cytochrome bc complex cytochrome b subunit [Steroidobacteraceae bacterium]|nr:cytochrome bc complex cytochrome b subunit [Steroidobacteraceae bacterium]